MKYFTALMAGLLLAACSVSSGGENTDKMESAAVSMASSLPVLSGGNVWRVNKAESRLNFIATHNSREFTGSFSNFAAAIKLNPDNPEGGEIHAVIDLTSADAGDRDRNANLPSKDWFYTASFPMATFSSKDIKAVGGGNYKAAGELNLKGVTRPVTLAFSLQVTGDAAAASGGAELNRTDFGVGQGPDFSADVWVKFPVKVTFEIKAVR